MADNRDKEAAKAAKAAAKAAEKEKKERIKNNKPKKDPNAPNIFVRIGRAIARFFKDFRGTAKKVVWPDRKTVFKSTLVVIVCVLIVGICVWVVDWALSGTVSLATKGVVELALNEGDEEEGTTAPAADTTEGTTAAVTEEGTTAPASSDTATDAA